jgi:hypothetical protein
VSTYKKVRSELAEQRDHAYNCRVCNASAQWKTLSDHGGMCYPCYQHYCGTSMLSMRDVGSRDQPRSWAHALKLRHDSGERLTPAQVNAYRSVLKEGA